MTTFKRYFSVFLTIGIVIFVLGCALTLKDNFKWHNVIAFILAIFIYIFPMSLYLSQQASIVELKIIKSNENIITEIEKISTTKCNRENKEVKNGEIIYSMKNDFSTWLTNPIKVLDHGEYIILEVPRAYKNQFNNFL